MTTTVAGLRRYPVKSLRGEVLDTAAVDARGLVGDRLWALRTADGKLASGKNGRRFRRVDGLLALRAHYDGDHPVLTLPDGRECRGADVGPAAAEALGVPLTLVREDGDPHFDDGPVHLVTTSSLGHLAQAYGGEVDVRRFRPNLLLDTPGVSGPVEQDWIGRSVRVGADVVLDVVEPMPRCVMVTHAQDELPVDARVLHAVAQGADTVLGVWATVRRTGTVAVGDPVVVT